MVRRVLARWDRQQKTQISWRPKNSSSTIFSTVGLATGKESGTFGTPLNVGAHVILILFSQMMKLTSNLWDEVLTDILNITAVEASGSCYLFRNAKVLTCSIFAEHNCMSLYRKERRSHFHRRAISVQTQFQPTLSSLSKTCLTAFSKETEATLSSGKR